MTAVAQSAHATDKSVAQLSMAEIEASGRLPIIYLVAGGGAWLFIALLLLFIDSLKLHMPSFLAGEAFATYGRIRDAYVTSFLYGCGVEWAIAGSLWLLCHVGRARVVSPAVIFIGALVWNAALTVGVLAILCGESTGFEPFAIPGYLAPILLVAYLLMAICAALTFHDRQDAHFQQPANGARHAPRTTSLYPSQWFVVGALFWFPWIFSTASLVLLASPVRGVLQAAVSWWFGHNFHTVFLGFAGLGLIFYFIPKISGRALSSYYLTFLAFWVIALFGSWGGIPVGAPLPAWIPSLGVVGTVLSSIAVLSVATNFYSTTKGAPCAPCNDIPARFIFAGLAFWMLASVQEIVGALPCVSAITDFTWYREAQHELFYFGFFSMTLFGAIYYFVPRLLASQSPAKSAARSVSQPNHESGWAPGLTRAHFWLAFLGVLITWLSLLIGGLWQGLLLQDPSNTFASTMSSTLPAIRGSTLGVLLLLIGAVVFLLNLALLLSPHLCGCCKEKVAMLLARKERA